MFESEEDAETREIAEKYGITVTKAEFLKHLFSENPGITKGKQEELAGYSSKRLIREINEQEYQLSLKPVVVKTTFEKASEETTEESTPEETTALETTEAASEQKSESSDANEERESTKNDGLSEMQRRRKALEAGESVDWVDQETSREQGDPDEKDRHSSNSWTSPTETAPLKTAEPKTVEPKTAEPGTAAPETVPPETAPPTAPETTAAVTETTAASGMLTPETKTPAYLRGPGFEDPDNPRNQN